MLNAKKRIQLPPDLARWVREATSPFREAPLTHDIAVASHKIPVSHNDPADRFLAATARVLRLTLVTADVNLLGLGDISTLANR
jgi:PIN domain nuclease of toxin-antitoxin system